MDSLDEKAICQGPNREVQAKHIKERSTVGAQVEEPVAESKPVMGKAMNREKGEIVSDKSGMVGGKVSIESDRSAAIPDQSSIQERKARAWFKICINEIDDETAKHNMARYLSSILDIDYIDIRISLSKKTPLVLPDEFSYKQAKDIRTDLEEFGSKVLIIGKRDENAEVFSSRYQRKRVNRFIFICIVLLLLFTSILLTNNRKTDDKGVKADNNQFKNEVEEPPLEKAGNKVPSPLADEALTALRTVETGYQGGISYREYVEELRKAKLSVNRFLESQEARNRVYIASSIRNAVVHYENAAKVWAYNTKSPEGYLSNTRDDLRLYLDVYPHANKPKEMGGASGTVGESSDVIWMDRLISIIIGEASKELTRASRILSIDSSPS